MSPRRRTEHYGPDRRQVGDLWLPATAGAPVPVVVLVHGGFWRARYTRRLMNRLAADVVRRGWAAWNVEYRRVGRFGGGGNWSDSVDDVAAALMGVGNLAGVDPERVAVCGHSAGAQLALSALNRTMSAPRSSWPGASEVHVRVAVSLAGVLDLVDGAPGRGGRRAVVSFLGGTPEAVPGRYAACSPAMLLPMGIDQVVVHGKDDSVVPLAVSQRYAAAADAAGDGVVLEAVAAHGHLAVIDPRRDAWRIVVGHLDRFLGQATDPRPGATPSTMTSSKRSWSSHMTSTAR